MLKGLSVILLISLFFAPSTPHSAEFPISGKVTDRTGKAIENATVTLKNAAESTVTDSEGRFGISTATIPE